MTVSLMWICADDMDGDKRRVLSLVYIDYIYYVLTPIVMNAASSPPTMSVYITRWPTAGKLLNVAMFSTHNPAQCT